MPSEIELSELADEAGSISFARLGSTVRSRHDSWKQLPQGVRGITLQELWDLYDAHKAWLEQKQWRCSACKRCHPDTEGPCPNCGGDIGVLQMRNLYEVNDVIIKPTCADRKISYVELLTNLRGGGAVEVDTFVSHWWGEEFPKFMMSLDHYARVQCAKHQNRWPSVLTFVLSAVSYPICMGMLFPADYTKEQWRSVRKNAIQMLVLSGINVMLILATTALCIMLTRRRQDPRRWSFWICAFCNNQFYIDHAMGIAGDATTSSFATALQADSCKGVAAVIDCGGEIYRRIWCDFELFFVSTVLPDDFDKHMEISFVNEHGVLSDGDASQSTVSDLQRTISLIETANSRASVEKDMIMIREALHAHGTSYAELDKILRDLACAGIKAVTARKWAPLILFTLGPLCGTSWALGLHGLYDVVRRILHGKKNRAIHIYFPGFRAELGASDAAFGILFGLIFLLAIRCCLGGLSRRRGAAFALNTYQRRLGHRLAWIVVMFSIPPMLISLLHKSEETLFRLRIVPQRSLRYSKILCLANALGQESAMLMAIVGALLGVFYTRIRDGGAFNRMRSSVEDVFFA